MRTTNLFTLLAALVCTTTAWAADYTVATDSELRTVIQNNGANITVTADINLSNSTLSIEGGTTVTINLGGHTLDRKLTQRDYDHGGQVITVRSGGRLNLSNGTLKGGWGGDSGGINNEGGVVNLTDVNITGCTGDDRGGGICNRYKGTLTMTGGSITGNTSKDNKDYSWSLVGGGGIFNDENCTMTLIGVTISGNKATQYGGGGICNYGKLTLNGCTITDNIATTSGGGIWTNVSLNMSGVNTISGNTAANNNADDLYLRSNIINVTGSLAGSSIGIKVDVTHTFTKGYNTYNSGVDPATIFFADLSNVQEINLDINNEAQIATIPPEGGLAGTGTPADPYIIADLDDWATFANEAYYDVYWKVGRYVRLDADLEFGAAAGMIGTNSHPFNATFDGDGHTITMDIASTEESTALFRYVGNATIRNLHTAGTIHSTAKLMSGLVGLVKSGMNMTIENCRSSVRLESTVSGDGTSAGFIACIGEKDKSASTVCITNCLFDGYLIGTNTGRWGGFVGWNHYSATITNCLFAPSDISVKDSENKTFIRYGDDNGNTISNSYYKTQLGAAQGDAVGLKSASQLAEALGVEWYVSGVEVLPYLNVHSLYKSSLNMETYYPYTGSQIAINYTLTENTYGQPLTEGTHYSVKVNDVAKDPAENLSVTDVGEYTLTFTGIGAYHGSIKKTIYVLRQLAGDGTAESPFLITNADDWSIFVSHINVGSNADKYYKLSDSFDNMTDAITETVGLRDDYPFSGTFDGNLKTLNVNINSTAMGIYVNEQGVAPFHYIKNATIKRLTVEGTIASASYYTSGLVGFADGTNTIDRCVVAATISLENDYAGGIVGHGLQSTTTITNTVFAGKFYGIGSGRTAIGGIWGWGDEGSSPTLKDCLEKGSYTDISSMHPIGLMGGAGSLSDCFYLHPQIGIPDQVCTLTGYKRAYATAPTTAMYKQFELADRDDYWVASTPTMLDHYKYTGQKVTLVYSVQDAKGNSLTEGVDYTVAIKNSEGQTVEKANLSAEDSYQLVFTALTPHIGTDVLDFVITEGTEVTSETTTMENAVYVVKSNVTVSERITVLGDVELYLNQGCTLKASKGIELSDGNKLAIFGPGTLTATGEEGNWWDATPGIGAKKFGTLVINSGTVNATGGGNTDFKGCGAAGIGGTTNNVAGGYITINGGVVNAQGKSGGAGIGGGGNRGSWEYGMPMDIIINGGKVKARVGALNIENVEEGRAIGMGIPSVYEPIPHGTLTLNWTNDDDYIDADSYGGFKKVILIKSFIDTENKVHSPANPNLNGKKLMPFNNGVSTDSELRNAITKDGADIIVTADFDLSNSTLEIASNKTITIDLNSHTLNRKLTQRNYDTGGQVFTVRSSATLNLSNGTLTGGWGGDSGGIVNYGGTVNLTDVTITGCTGDDRGGGICNRDGGTLTMTGGSITNNISNDKMEPEGGGGIFNAEGATMTLTSVTITGNEAKEKGGGGVCNYGTLNINDCTLQDNTAGKNGGGIWNGPSATLSINGITISNNTASENGGGIFSRKEGTLNIKGAVNVSDNMVNGANQNIYLQSGKLINVTGSLAGSSIGIYLDGGTGTFTSGYDVYNNGVDPSTLFFSDLPETANVTSAEREAQMANNVTVTYIERSWDDVNKVVVSTPITLTNQIPNDQIPQSDTDFKVITAGSEELTLGGMTTAYPETYVVRGSICRDALRVMGGDVHLVLCDGATLNVHGVVVNSDCKLYIHSQSYGASMGKLRADNNGYNESIAGIGSEKGQSGDIYIEIQGGDIYAKGGDRAAGIGGGENSPGANVTIIDGIVEAHAGKDEDGCRAIGPGRDSDNYGSLTIGDEMMVSSERRASAEERKDLCWNRTQVRIEPCTHEGATCAVIDGSSHSVTGCNYCTISTQAHSFGSYSECSACHLVCLADDADNSDIIAHWAEENGVHAVILTERTLYKDGNWNTLCLPFSLASLTGTPLADATVKTLNSTAFTNGTLTLNFSEDNLTSIEAGKPYIVKWVNTKVTEGTEDTELKNPVFENVIIANATSNVEAGYVDFIGIYSPKTFTSDDKSKLYLGSDNELYYPSQAMTINACRAYFQLHGITAADLNEQGDAKQRIVLNFGDGDNTETNGIKEIVNSQSANSKSDEAWYDLSGRRISVPSVSSASSVLPKGVYIYKGKKIIIK